MDRRFLIKIYVFSAVTDAWPSKRVQLDVETRQQVADEKKRVGAKNDDWSWNPFQNFYLTGSEKNGGM
jgi:hypothetical protein